MSSLTSKIGTLKYYFKSCTSNNFDNTSTDCIVLVRFLTLLQLISRSPHAYINTNINVVTRLSTHRCKKNVRFYIIWPKIWMQTMLKYVQNDKLQKPKNCIQANVFVLHVSMFSKNRKLLALQFNNISRKSIFI